MKVIKSKSKSVQRYIPSIILSMGHYDINYSITLSEDDLIKFKIEDLTVLKTYEDISFIINNKYLWNKIEIETDNKIINTLLYLNKINKDSNKSYIEYISIETPFYYNEEVETMIKTVNDFNFFFVNDCHLDTETKKYFKLKIKFQNQETEFIFDKKDDKKDDENDKDEHYENQNNENNENNIKEESKQENKSEDVNENKKEEDNKGYLKNQKNIFNKIKLDCVNYNHFLCLIEDTLEISPYEDFIEFIVYLKLTYNTLISIEYNDVSNLFNDKDSMVLLNKIYLLTDIFLFEEKDAHNNFKKHYEILSEGNDKKNKKYDENKNQKDNESIEENKIYSNINININTNSRKRLENNKSSNAISSKYNNTERTLSEKDIFDYFKHTIACNGSLSIYSNKLGIFLDNNFSKITFLEVPMNSKAIILSYEIKPYPKLTHTTVDLVESYRGKLRQKKDFFKSIFYGGILNKIFSIKTKNIGLEILYSAYLTGHEILKKMLHIITNDIPVPKNQNFYIIKINSNEVNDYVKREYLNKKENKFVLDCTNYEKSKLKYYVPLFDYNLQEFFENKKVQKDLINKGFINSKGFVNYDPVYRQGMKIPKTIMQRNNSFLNQNNNYIKQQVRTNSRNRILNCMSPPTKIKLPKIPNRYLEKLNNSSSNSINKKNYSKEGQKNKNYLISEKPIIDVVIEGEKRQQFQMKKNKNT